jgi:hypothetical protein
VRVMMSRRASTGTSAGAPNAKAFARARFERAGAACGCIARMCAKRIKGIVRRAPSGRLRAGERLEWEKNVDCHRKRARITGGPSQGPGGADAFSPQDPQD